MRPSRPYLLTAVCLLGSACGGLLDPGMCTTEYVYGLNVQVQDSLTGAWIASGSTLIVRDGNFEDSVTAPVDRPHADDYPLVAAGERPGTYEVVVRREGYQPWRLNEVKVRGGTCHVERVRLVARLQR